MAEPWLCLVCDQPSTKKLGDVWLCDKHFKECSVSQNFEVRNPTIEAVQRELGKLIKSLIPPGWGFTLLVFQYGEKGNLFYISSAQRDDMVRTMQEFIEHNRG